tara:strand:- start:102 stop:308 length:207 start_codon:yes stop_codon:yes gene_type:complete
MIGPNYENLNENGIQDCVLGDPYNKIYVNKRFDYNSDIQFEDYGDRMHHLVLKGLYRISVCILYRRVI